MNHQISDTAYKYPDACPKHGYDLEWRAYLRYLGSKSSREFNRQYSEATGPAAENFPAKNHYDSDSFDGPSNYSERLASTPSDGTGVAKDKLSEPRKRRNRLHKNANTKSGIMEGDVENEIEYLPLSEEMPQESRNGSSRRRDTNEKRRASDRHVNFVE